MGFVGELMSGKYGVEWYYIAGLLIFICLFILILIRTLRLTKQEVKGYKNMVFESDNNSLE
ncbi:MAG: hypothetical protein V2I37_14205 [Marinilabiliaceae bacterium]|nr:hypothetical protein [Marinilabiliaceae bacterium]